MNNIGRNWYHMRIFIQNGLGGMLDGSEALCLSLSLPIIEET
jgi:hypothetical protein